MGNQDIAEEIKTKIDICKENIKTGKVAENEKIILEIEKLIEQYKPENNTQKVIINNRISEVNSLKNYGQNGEKKMKKRNTFYGNVDKIDFADCEKWIKENEDNLQSKVNDIKTFSDKFPFKDNSINGLSIKEYVIGTLQNTFCWYLENATPGDMGIGSSLDYYIYWSWDHKSYCIRDGVHKKLVDLNEAEKVFYVLKINLEKMLKLVNTDKINVIEEQRLDIVLPKAHVLQKILFLYFPDKFFGYYSKDYVSKIAAMVGLNINADVYQTNHTISQKVVEKIANPKLSAIDKNVGFGLYLYNEWNDYIRKSVGRT